MESATTTSPHHARAREEEGSARTAAEPNCFAHAAAERARDDHAEGASSSGEVAAWCCYDGGDRLTSTTDPRYSTISYDAHGNTTTLGDKTLTYDGADRHVTTSGPIGTTTGSIHYTRDATDRIIARTSTGPAIDLRDSTSNQAASATTLTIDRPVGVQPSDVLIAQVAYAGANVTLTPPPGWTLHNTATQAGQLTQAVYYRDAGSAEPATYTFTISAARALAGGIAAYYGVDPTNPFLTATTSATSNYGTNYTTPALTLASAPAQLVHLVSSTGTSTTPASGMGEQWDIANGGVQVAMADQTLAATGSTGTRTAVGSLNDYSATHLLALRPWTVARTVRYGFTGSGDSPQITQTTSGTTIETTNGLFGGVLLTKRDGGNLWSFPDVRGNIMFTTDASAVPSGRAYYDPYGQPIAAPTDNAEGAFDSAWLGQHQRPTDTQFADPIVEMGARVYVPGFGRFLQVDPVFGGSANGYDYCNGNPIGCVDLDGLSPKSSDVYETFELGLKLCFAGYCPEKVTLRYGSAKWGLRHIQFGGNTRNHPDHPYDMAAFKRTRVLLAKGKWKPGYIEGQFVYKGSFFESDYHSGRGRWRVWVVTVDLRPNRSGSSDYNGTRGIGTWYWNNSLDSADFPRWG